MVDDWKESHAAVVDEDGGADPYVCPEEEDDVQPINGADREVRRRLRDRALLTRALGTLSSSAN